MDLFLDACYEYVCTCEADADTLKLFMGASLRSNDIFSSCSEGGQRAQIAAEMYKDESYVIRKMVAMEEMSIAASNATID